MWTPKQPSYGTTAVGSSTQGPLRSRIETRTKEALAEDASIYVYPGKEGVGGGGGETGGGGSGFYSMQVATYLDFCMYVRFECLLVIYVNLLCQNGLWG